MRTHYDNLQVTRNASPEVIKGAYKYLSQKWHPDKHQVNREEAERNLKIINQAYEVLSDPELRIEHDRWIRSVEAEEARSKGAKHRESDNHDQTSSDSNTDAAGYENRTPPMADPKDKSARVEGSSVTLTAVIGFGLILIAMFNFWHGNFEKGVITAAIGAAFLFGSWLIKGQWERENQTRAAKHFRKAPMFVQMWSDIEAFIEGFRKGLNEPEKPARERATKKSKETPASVPADTDWGDHRKATFWGRASIILSWSSYTLGVIAAIGAVNLWNEAYDNPYEKARLIPFALNCGMVAIFLVFGPKQANYFWKDNKRRLSRFSAFIEWASLGIALGVFWACGLMAAFAFTQKILSEELLIRLLISSVAGAVPWGIVSALLFLTGTKDTQKLGN